MDSLDGRANVVMVVYGRKPPAGDRRRAPRWWLAGLGVLALLIAPGPARAAFPGGNGELVLAAACKTPVSGCHGLEVVRPNGAGLRLLCPQVPACAQASSPTWSPDGRRVAFASSLWGTTWGSGFVYADVVYGEGSCFVCGLLEASQPRGDLGTLYRPAWTADGRHLINDSPYMYGATLDGDDGLAGPLLLSTIARTDDAAVSSRGVLAFARAKGRAQRNLFLLHLGSRRVRRLTNSGGAQPSWSPDGSQLAFVRRNDIYIVAEDGRGSRLLVRDAGDPAWSPDGRLIAFVRRNGGAPGQVLTISIHGDRARVIPGVSADEIDWRPVIRARQSRCGFGPRASILLRGHRTVVATRSFSSIADINGQVWLACLGSRGTPRVLWSTRGDSYQPLDTLAKFRASGSSVAFVADSFFSHYGDGSETIEVLDLRTGLHRPSPLTFALCRGRCAVMALTLDAIGDVAWIATMADDTGHIVAKLGLDDAHGTHILDQGKSGDLTALHLTRSTVTWHDRGQPRSAVVAAP